MEISWPDMIRIAMLNYIILSKKQCFRNELTESASIMILHHKPLYMDFVILTQFLVFKNFSKLLSDC